MDDDESQLSIEVRFSQLRRIVEENEDHVDDPMTNSQGYRHASEQQSNSQTRRDSDSGYSDISTENGDGITQVFRKNASNLETLIEKSDDFNSSYRTFSDQDRKSDSPLTYIANNTDDNADDNNGKNTGDKDDTNEQKFSFKTLTRAQKVILASTSFTNLLSYLSLSILAPFFPKEVGYYLFSFLRRVVSPFLPSL